MPRTRIKICGITSATDAVTAVNFGADYIGLNFLAGPRRINETQGARIYWALRDDDTATIRRADIVALCAADNSSFPGAATWDNLGDVFPYRVDVYQLYSAAYKADRYTRYPGLQWWMVAPVAGRQSLANLAVQIGLMDALPAALVLDTAVKGSLGGTGQSFNWNWIAEARAAGELRDFPPIVLAGGLTPDNVAEAIRIARPYAVDVSSGVELPNQPGIKDPARLKAFIQAVKAAESASA